MIDLCSYLLQTGFKYVLLRDIQSDRIEGEFAVHRQSTGANSYMSSVDVTSAFKRRLTRFAASFLESLDNEFMNPSTAAHNYLGDIVAEDASSIEKILSDTPVSPNEGRASAYVAGWLEFECRQELSFGKDDQLLDTTMKDFIEETSRGSLSVHHVSIDNFYDYVLSTKKLMTKLANVLLSGLHNLEKDLEKTLFFIRHQ